MNIPHITNDSPHIAAHTALGVVPNLIVSFFDAGLHTPWGTWM